jgi:hypothetical protein
MTSERNPTGGSVIRQRLNVQSKPALLSLGKTFTTHYPAIAISCTTAFSPRQANETVLY